MAIYVVYTKEEETIKSLFSNIEQITSTIPSIYDINNINLNGHSPIDKEVTAFELPDNTIIETDKLSITNKTFIRKLNGNNFVTVIEEPIEATLATLRDTLTLKINADSYDKIIATYPIYLQLNIEREFDEGAKVSMHAYIDVIRNFANTAKASLVTATSEEDMSVIYSTFVSSLASV